LRVGPLRQQDCLPHRLYAWQAWAPCAARQVGVCGGGLLWCSCCGLTPPSSGQTTAGSNWLFCEHCARRCLPLMSNVSRHMQSCQANGSAVKARAALRHCAVQRNGVGGRKAQLALPLRRAVRPAAAGAPIVQASLEQRPASCRAVRPPAASAPVCVREQEFGGLRGLGQCFSTHANTRSLPRPCEYAAPAPLRSSATAGIGRAAHAGGGVGSVGRMHKLQASCSRHRCAVFEQNTVTANPSVERTNNGGRQCAVKRALRAPLFAAHLQR
jgi:hypothetical protein